MSVRVLSTNCGLHILGWNYLFCLNTKHSILNTVTNALSLQRIHVKLTMKRHSIIIAFTLLLSSAAIAQQNDCHLMMDKAVEGKRLKATKRSGLVEMADFGMGVMLQNYTGNITMVLDIAINGKRITKN